jgi:exo-beta-1,3-glucanase (GH17 family)
MCRLKFGPETTRGIRLIGVVLLLAVWNSWAVAVEFPLFGYITGEPKATMIAYTPLELDPRNPANQERVSTTSLRKDLAALRPAFDGLVLYGYHEACTPRIVSLAHELKFRAVLLGIWQPKSAAECDGVAELVRQFHGKLALGVLVGNEGLTFDRYEEDDVRHAAARLRSKLPEDVPLTTSEPLVGYQRKFVLEFGDFLAPNIHPVFDRPQLEAAGAAAWVHEQAQRLATESKKPVLVKETGFPHAGKPIYTPATQAAFWKAYAAPPLVKRAREDSPWVYHGVAFEAFDLPWKSEASGMEIEKSWGLLSTERKPYPATEIWRAIAGEK